MKLSRAMVWARLNRAADGTVAALPHKVSLAKPSIALPRPKPVAYRHNQVTNLHISRTKQPKIRVRKMIFSDTVKK
jgi:hypothetical protein